MQGTPTNFETDLFMPMIKATEKISGKAYAEPNLMAFRVIADHARCLTFALSDGAYFSNEGRGYVLRRIIRRAMRYGQKLGIHEPFMYKLVQVVADKYKDFYPELEGHVEMVSKMVKGEEEKFIKTLDAGEAMLREMLKGTKKPSPANRFSNSMTPMVSRAISPKKSPKNPGSKSIWTALISSWKSRRNGRETPAARLNPSISKARISSRSRLRPNSSMTISISKRK
jgi:hypothetical protein